jgi:hypothetical protein
VNFGEAHAPESRLLPVNVADCCGEAMLVLEFESCDVEELDVGVVARLTGIIFVIDETVGCTMCSFSLSHSKAGFGSAVDLTPM